MPLITYPPVVLRAGAPSGVSWVAYCPTTRACVLVDADHASSEVAELVRDERLRVVASLGTRSVPRPTEGPPSGRYAQMLGRLGLASAVSAATRVGPTPGWEGATLIEADGRVVELDPNAEQEWVVGERPAMFDVRVRSAVIRFGDFTAVSEIVASDAGCEVGWRIGDDLFRAGMTEAPGEDGDPVLNLPPVEVARIATPIVLDVEPVGSDSPLILGARRVGPRFDPDEFEIDGTRRMIFASEFGHSCGPPTRRLARLGFDVARVHGGTRAWMQAGFPTGRDTASPNPFPSLKLHAR